MITQAIIYVDGEQWAEVNSQNLSAGSSEEDLETNPGGDIDNIRMTLETAFTQLYGQAADVLFPELGECTQ